MADLETVWNQRHAAPAPWGGGQPCSELKRVLDERAVAPCRALEFGCGHGSNAVYLAQRGFKVDAMDVAEAALARARAAAQAAGVPVRFFRADAAKLPELGAPYPFLLDRGMYQHVRATDGAAFQQVLARVSAPGGLYLVMVPSANDRELNAPRALQGDELRSELAGLFDLVQLREFRADPAQLRGREMRPLMWSALYRRR